MVEVVFVDSSTDAATYEDSFSSICSSLASTLSGQEHRSAAAAAEPPEPAGAAGDPGGGAGTSRPSGSATPATTLCTCRRLLGVFPADGDFGPITDAAVKGYQAAYGEGVTCDGIVGPKTWAALDYLADAKGAGNDRLPLDQARRIVEHRGEAAR